MLVQPDVMMNRLVRLNFDWAGHLNPEVYDVTETSIVDIDDEEKLSGLGTITLPTMLWVYILKDVSWHYMDAMLAGINVYIVLYGDKTILVTSSLIDYVSVE